jgi:GNAT superfamily N-acetyltransferase
MNMGDLEIRRSDLTAPDAVRLIAALNAELMALFPEAGATHFALAAEQVADGDGAFLIAYVDGTAIGCGAIRRIDRSTVEMKRMFVEKPHRGRGIGRALVTSLEDEARRLGASRIVLETGSRLPAAMALYRRMGYSAIPLFGEYLASPETSRCFGKTL